MAAHRALIVIGMHRSGTSALTRVVNILGAALPTQLLQLDPAIPNETNDLGFWEGLEVNTLNNEFLSSIGSSWDDTARIPEAVFRSDAARSMRDRIVRHLEVEFKDAPLFAIKDPRIARLAPLWIEALKAFGAEPNFILAFRNPAEVAQSLLKRDRMGRGQATVLWLRYMLEAERYTRNFRRSFVPYEALLENWRGAARRIAEDCDFVWPRFNAGAELAIDAFVSADRRHNSASVSQWAEFPQWPRDVHNIFQQGANGACLDADVADRISAELDRAGAVFDGYICELDLKVRTQSGELEGLELSLSERQSDLANLQTELERFQVQHESLGRSSAEDQRTFERRLAELQAEHNLLEATLAAKSGEVAQLQGAFDKRLAELDAERASRSALEERSTQLETALAARSSEVVRLQGEIEAASTLAHQQRLASEQERHKLEQRLHQAEAAARASLVLRRRLEEANDQSDQAREQAEHHERMVQNANAALATTKITLSTMAKKLHVKTSEADSAIAELAKARSELHLAKEGADEATADLAAAHSELDLLKGELRERDALRTQLDAVLVSRTWRLTAPVRRLVGKAKITLARFP